MIRAVLPLCFAFASVTAGVVHAQPAASTPAGSPLGTPVPVPPPPASPGARDVGITGAPGRGFVVRAKDDSFSTGVRARLQARDTFTLQEGKDATSDVQLKTVRLFWHGHVLRPQLRYLIQLAVGAGDFEAGSSSPIFDAFVEYTAIRDLQLRAGQYFVPFDRARTIREFALQLVDRQQVVRELSLDRDIGVTVSSDDLFGLGGRLTYAASVFGGSGRNNTRPERIGALWALRVGYRPFGAFDDDVEGDLARSSKARLALGVAGAYNDNSSRAQSTIGTTFEGATFDYRHAAGDLVFKWSGLSLLAEALYREAPVEQKSVLVNGRPTTYRSRSAWGYLVQGGYMLTDKIEVAGRWDELFTIGATDPSLVALVDSYGREVGGGVNLYLNGHLFKLQADWSSRFGSVGEPIHVARVQLDASF